MWSFSISIFFFKKFLKIFNQNFWNIFTIKKIIILVVKSVRNHHIEHSFAKSSIKTPKMSIFLYRPLFFSKFWRLWRWKCGVLGPLGIQSLWSCPLAFGSSPQNASEININRCKTALNWKILNTFDQLRI